MKEFKIEIIIKEKENGDIAVTFDTENRTIVNNFEFEGYPGTARGIQDWILGEIARMPYEDILKKK